MLEFWQRARKDGLLPKRCDLPWLSETATLLAHVDTFLLLSATTQWDFDEYRAWLTTSWRRLVASSTES